MMFNIEIYRYQRCFKVNFSNDWNMDMLGDVYVQVYIEVKK